MTHRTSRLWILILALSTSAANAAGPCGDTVEVRRGDTLSSIAGRCDVPERTIILGNPGVQGSEDLHVGQRLSLQQSVADRAFGALDSATRKGADALAGLAQDVKSSVADLLDKNPDLRRRIESVGRSVAGTPERPQGSVSLSLTQGPTEQRLRVTAEKLPQDASVVIGLGFPGSAYETVSKAQTTATGGLDVVLDIPGWARNGQLRAVVSGKDGGWTVRSEPLRVGAR